MIKLEISSYGNTYWVWLPVYEQPNNTNQIEHMVETISINDRRITQPCRRSWMSISDMLFAEWTLHKGPASQLAQRSTSFSLSMTFDNRITSHCWVMLRNDYARVLCVKLFVSILVWLANANESWNVQFSLCEYVQFAVLSSWLFTFSPHVCLV